MHELYKDYNPTFHRAIQAYRIEISPQIYTLLITVKKGDHEMETLLVNYDHFGQVLDHEQVSYDEIAEEQSRIKSKITHDNLIGHRLFYGNKTSIEQQEFHLKDNGFIDSSTSKVPLDISNLPMINIALEELKIELFDITIDLLTSKPHPENPDELIIVIPKIVKQENDYSQQ